MAQTVITMFDLPDAPLDAAAHFYAENVPMARELLSGEVALSGRAEALDALAFVFQP